jgi:hypothetical protein
MSAADPIASMVLDATSGIRDALTTVIKSHIATLIGGECSVRELANRVFNSEAEYSSRRGEKWIDELLRRAVQRHAEEIMEELLTERRDELREKIKETLAGKDIAGMMADETIRRVQR